MAKNIENPGAFLHRGSFNLYVLYYLPTPEIVFKSVGTYRLPDLFNETKNIG
jgi:hypothetical protein